MGSTTLRESLLGVDPNRIFRLKFNKMFFLDVSPTNFATRICEPRKEEYKFGSKVILNEMRLVTFNLKTVHQCIIF